MLNRLRVEPKTKSLLEGSLTLTDQADAAVAEVLFGLHPGMLFKLVGAEAIRMIQSDPELMKRFLAFGSDEGAFLLGAPKKTLKVGWSSPSSSTSSCRRRPHSPSEKRASSRGAVVDRPARPPVPTSSRRGRPVSTSPLTSPPTATASTTPAATDLRPVW